MPGDLDLRVRGKKWVALQLGRFEGSEEVKSRSAPEQVPAAGAKACSFVATMKKKKSDTLVEQGNGICGHILHQKPKIFVAERLRTRENSLSMVSCNRHDAARSSELGI